MRVLIVLAAPLALMIGACAPSDTAAKDSATTESEPELGATLHNSQNSLDWAGVYRGVLPCADCPGIETVVALDQDGRFRTASRYQDRGDNVTRSEGTFSWNAAGSEITLEGSEPARFRVEENRIVRLQQDGTRVTGANASHYELAKLMHPLKDRYWRLTELSGQPAPQLPRLPYFILNTEGNRVTGFGGCNTFSGGYTLDEAASRIQFGPAATTRMACAQGMDVENALHQMLQKTDNYALSGDSLVLNDAAKMPLARFEAVYLP